LNAPFQIQSKLNSDRGRLLHFSACDSIYDVSLLVDLFIVQYYLFLPYKHFLFDL